MDEDPTRQFYCDECKKSRSTFREFGGRFYCVMCGSKLVTRPVVLKTSKEQ